VRDPEAEPLDRIPQTGSLIGSPIPRLEDAHLVTGHGRYAGDISLPGVLHMAICRSPMAHARVRRIDLDRARRAPGVIAAWGLEDLPGLRRGMADRGAFGFPVRPRQVLAGDVIRYQGEPLAVIVAETVYRAEDARELVELDLEPLPSVGRLEDALAEGAALVHEEAESNVVGTIHFGFGDVETAFSAAAVTVKALFRLPRISGGYLEPRTVTAAPEGDGIVVWTSTQWVFGVRDQVARLLGMEASRVRVVAHDVGGGFGPKGEVYAEDVLVAAAARRLGRPVRWAGSRSEDTMTTALGHGSIAEMELAADADGTLRGLRGRLLHDTGAYTTTGTGQPRNMVTHMVSAYRLPAMSVDASVVHTNTVPGGFVRGGGREVGNFVIERMMDQLAVALRKEPWVVRRQNLICPQQMPYETGLSGVTYDSGDYGQLLTLVEDQLAAVIEGPRDDGWLVGRGIVCCVESSGVGTNEPARARLNNDGKAELYIGSTPHGQGHLTMAGQMFAERLGWRLDRVSVVAGDTSVLPSGGMTAGSRSAVQIGNVSALVGRRLRTALLERAAEILEADPADLVMADSVIHVKGFPARHCTVLEVIPEEGLEVSAAFSLDGSATYACSCHGAVVAVDPECGTVRLERYIIANDSGRIINPTIVAGQLHGGFAHGLGYALIEEAVYTQEGTLLTATFVDYEIPSAPEVPVPELYEVQTQPTQTNPERIKGAGESGTLPVMAAISSAVERAVRFVNPHAVVSELPLTPERVLRLFQGPLA
jgi:carbon-monoxide dehydrogenase large subunit